MMTDDELIEAWLTNQRGRSFSENTITRRRLALRRWRGFIAPSGLADAKAADVDEWLAHLCSPRTRHAYRSDVNMFYRWAIRRDLATRNPVDGTDGVRVPKSLPKPASAEAIAGAVTIADGDVQLAILLGALAGLRLSEIASLESGDLQLDAEVPVIMVRAGKGAKDRIVPLHPTLVPRLQGRHGWIFAKMYGPGHVSAITLGRRITKALSATGKHYTTHSLRHYFGTEAAKWSGGNLLLVRDLLGHTDADTSLGYIAFMPTDGAEVVNKIVTAGVDDELTLRRQQRSA